MKRCVPLVVTLALAGLALVSALSAVAKPGPAQCRHPHNLWADLDVAKVTIHIPGVPAGAPYLVENRNGSTQHFDAHVDVKNIGGAAACRSTLLVLFDQDLVIIKKRHLTVSHLAPGQSALIVVDVPHLRLKGLFPFEVIAAVNRNHYIPELSHHNNLDGVNPDTPVIARFWKVTRWSTHTVTPAPPTGGLSDAATTRADPSFYFRYSRYDSQHGGFLYNAYGLITDDRGLSGSLPGGHCTGSGTGHASHSPWLPSSFLGINYSETGYLASLDTKSAGDHYTTTLTCPAGTSTDPNTPFTDLETFPFGPQSTNLGDKRLTGAR